MASLFLNQVILSMSDLHVPLHVTFTVQVKLTVLVDPSVTGVEGIPLKTTSTMEAVEIYNDVRVTQTLCNSELSNTKYLTAATQNIDQNSPTSPTITKCIKVHLFAVCCHVSLLKLFNFNDIIVLHLGLFHTYVSRKECIYSNHCNPLYEGELLEYSESLQVFQNSLNTLYYTSLPFFTPNNSITTLLSTNNHKMRLCCAWSIMKF